ncbi:MAG: glycerol-3-phosphate dehydrogenase/oxidase [Planctomycetia bacterium]|nr:glycerol-3-phosphate dehydrogenase/oxidase [Planctomycetia bacterium]
MSCPERDRRSKAWDCLAVHAPSRNPLDLVVVGGGATGLGVALDAAARGFSVALFEADDVAKGTSSRATKLVHGGVRYLAQGDFKLVREALRERALVLANAAHLASALPFVLPTYGWRGRLWDRWFYGAGLAVYDALAGGASLGRAGLPGPSRLLALAPGTRADGLAGGVTYVDGQFDDARLAVALARTAEAHGATVLTYCRVVGLATDTGGPATARVHGVEVEDRETGRRFTVSARCVVNATGVWVDSVRRLDDASAATMVSPSQGAHLVVDRGFFPGDHALIVPKTSDGRVLFAVPWLGKLILGTTDTPLPASGSGPDSDPRPLAEEVDFILAEAANYLARPPRRADVRSAWAGLRPLVKPPQAEGRDTKRISREHAIEVSKHGLVTVTGGKWTTYRAMAEDVLAACFRADLLPERPAGVTRTLRLVGAPPPGAARVPLSAPPGLHLYGSEAAAVAALPGATRDLLPGLSEAMVRFAVRHEFARTVEDVLARRSRWLFLDAATAASVAADVAAIMAEELAGDPAGGARVRESAGAFIALAATYRLTPAP